MKKSAWLCSYDICDKRRLSKVHRTIAAQGIAMNYSVFYLYLTDKQLQTLQEKIRKQITKDDDVRFYACATWQQAQHLTNNQSVHAFLLL